MRDKVREADHCWRKRRMNHFKAGGQAYAVYDRAQTYRWMPAYEAIAEPNFSASGVPA